MKVLFFLLFIILFCYRVQVCKSERLNDGFGFYSNDLYFAQKQYDKYSKKYMRVNFPITYEKYPKRIPTFVDDTYSCRVPLGMSYFMLKGTSPNKPKSSSVLTYPITLNHFYKFYDLATYALQLSYNDRGFRFKYYETSDYYGRNYGDYVSFVDIKLHGMSVVDGLIVNGGSEYKLSRRIRCPSSWVYALIRWSVNYTMDYKEWLPYRNKEGKVHVFSLLETNRKNGVSYSGYTKFEPRIVARGIRLITVSYRLGFDLGPGLSVEVFGCSYDGENAGLQTPVRNKKGNYWLTRETVLPWQLYGENTPTTIVSPTKQAAMALSRFYTEGLQKGGMPQGFGHCQRFRSKNPVRLNMVQKGEYWFPKGSPLRYKERNYKKRISDCVANTQIRVRRGPPKYSSQYCFGKIPLYFHTWNINASQKIQPLQSKYYKTWYDKNTNELVTVVPKKPKRSHSWCAQNLARTKFSFKPYPIKRTTDCNDVIMEFGHTFCINSARQYWELDFKKIHLVDSLKFKGHSEVVRNSWASHVIVLYSTDGHIWLPIKSRYSEKWYFQTNTGPKHTSHHPLNPRIRARFLRITPHKGKNDLCLRIEVRGCTKEPWLAAQQKIKDDAERISFNLWHVVVSKWNKGTTMPIKCFPHEAKVKGTETVYEVHGSYEFPLKLKKNMLKLEEQKEAKFYKCIARDQMNRIISTQLYIITTYGHPGLLLPVQEQGLLHQGGTPVLDPYGTIWAYEPVTAKITFLFFPDKTYAYEWYGFLDFMPRDYMYVKKLGEAVNKKQCFQLALYANERYFIFSSRRKGCYTSWALPYYIDAREKLGLYTPERRDSVYVIYQYRKPYHIYWEKGDKGIGTYLVGKQASQDHPNLQLLPYSVGKFRFRFDSYITTHGCDSHSLIIKDFTVDEVKHYTINIKEGKSSKPKVLFSRSVMLRHFGEPRFNMSATGGACLNHPLTITAMPLRGEYIEVEEWEVEWKKIENGKALKTNMETQDPFVLKVERATLSHSGVYRIRAKNRYGFAEGVIHIHVVERLPAITSVTSSPHVAVEDSSDILHVDLKNEEDLTSIDWYYNGKLIEIEDKHYSFPGALPGRPDSRKILKMSNLHLGMSGVYKVVTKAQFCEFPKEILVDVYVRPKMIVIPNVRTLYQIAGGNTTIIKVIIAGGVPMPKREHLVWYKGSKPLQVTRNGRVKIQNDEWLEKTDHSKDDITQSKPKRIGWNSTLSITSPHVTDSGKYFFMVSFPKTNYTVERIIKVTKL